MSATVCKACSDPLVLRLSADSDDEDTEMQGGSSSRAPTHSADQTMPDDCHLHCGCHFHWDCLLENFKSTSCPGCGTDLATTTSSGQTQLLCNLHNEGGLQRDHDVLPALREESYILAHPNERKPRAFLELCRNGDVPEIVELLQAEDEEDEDEEEESTSWTAQDILRYQDPNGTGFSGLHAAVAGQSPEVAWLLLLLASQLDIKHFPAEVMQEAVALGVERPDMGGRQDIRRLRDAQGRSAEQLAAEVVGRGRDGWGRDCLGSELGKTMLMLMASGSSPMRSGNNSMRHDTA